ncbi:hypothetical protein HID58_063729, partial [Brassica napus]
KTCGRTEMRPQNNGKREAVLLSKPAYNIGGRMWLKLLLIPRKFRTGDEHQEYSLDHSEPLLYFALCSGNHSDPAGIYQELENCERGVRSCNVRGKKDQKLVLPRSSSLLARLGVESSGIDGDDSRMSPRDNEEKSKETLLREIKKEHC